MLDWKVGENKQKPSFLNKIRKEGFMFITRFLAPQA
jgi:hypothetical protein